MLGRNFRKKKKKPELVVEIKRADRVVEEILGDAFKIVKKTDWYHPHKYVQHHKQFIRSIKERKKMFEADKEEDKR